MALVHRATLSPSKQELVESWLPTKPWAAGRTVTDKIAEYRFDDPAGEVGVETILWRTATGDVLQTPLTYRAEPLAGAEAYLIGTSEHSVLGRRWVYDGCGDPVWASTLAAVIVTGATQAQMYLVQDGERVDIPARMQVSGSGSGNGTDVPDVRSVDAVTDDGPTATVQADRIELAVARVVGTPIDAELTLTGTFEGIEGPVTLAALRR